jgi:hypothetical protein
MVLIENGTKRILQLCKGRLSELLTKMQTEYLRLRRQLVERFQRTDTIDYDTVVSTVGVTPYSTTKEYSYELMTGTNGTEMNISYGTCTLGAGSNVQFVGDGRYYTVPGGSAGIKTSVQDTTLGLKLEIENIEVRGGLVYGSCWFHRPSRYNRTLYFRILEPIGTLASETEILEVTTP